MTVACLDKSSLVLFCCIIREMTVSTDKILTIFIFWIFIYVQLTSGNILKNTFVSSLHDITNLQSINLQKLTTCDLKVRFLLLYCTIFHEIFPGA